MMSPFDEGVRAPSQIKHRRTLLVADSPTPRRNRLRVEEVEVIALLDITQRSVLKLCLTGDLGALLRQAPSWMMEVEIATENEMADIQMTETVENEGKVRIDIDNVRV